MLSKGQILSSCELFKNVEPQTLVRIAKFCETLEAHAGEAIVVEEMPANGLYIIAEGEVDYMKSMDEMSSLFLARRGPGDIFGFTSLFDRKGHLVTVIAVTPVKCLRLKVADFFKLCAEDPDFEHHVLEEMLIINSNYLRQITHRLREVLTKMLNNP
jgi:CRP-like cAMP-binding protein